MVKTVYIDVLFLVNFIINYLILFCTAHICAARIRRWRIVLGGIFGALYAVLTFVFAPVFLTSVASKLLSSLLMVLLALGRRHLLRRFLIFLAVTLAFGGTVFALSFLLRPGVIEITDGVFYINVSFPFLLFSTVLSYLLLCFIFRRQVSASPEKISSVKIFSENRELSLFALRDTGNSLRTLKNAPVLISDYGTLRDIFSDNVKSLLDATPPQSFPLILDKLSETGRFSLLPFRSVGTDFSLLLTFHPDKIEFDGIADSDTVIALSPFKISNNEKYSAIY